MDLLTPEELAKCSSDELHRYLQDLNAEISAADRRVTELEVAVRHADEQAAEIWARIQEEFGVSDEAELEETRKRLERELAEAHARLESAMEEDEE